MIGRGIGSMIAPRVTKNEGDGGDGIGSESIDTGTGLIEAGAEPEVEAGVGGRARAGVAEKKRTEVGRSIVDPRGGVWTGKKVAVGIEVTTNE